VIVFREAALVLLSYVVVVVASLLAYTVWLSAWLLGPFWRGVVSVLFWIVGFALGTQLFWSAAKLLQRKVRSN
jgi:hypothetical protein